MSSSRGRLELGVLVGGQGVPVVVWLVMLGGSIGGSIGGDSCIGEYEMACDKRFILPLRDPLCRKLCRKEAYATPRVGHGTVHVPFFVLAQQADEHCASPEEAWLSIINIPVGENINLVSAPHVRKRARSRTQWSRPPIIET